MNQSTDADPLLSIALETAKTAAYEAGRFLIKAQQHVHVCRKKALRDNLLDADLQAEAMILAKLRGDFPSHNILSEEDGATDNGSRYQWVVDPLDGSFSFHHQRPIYGIAIGLLVDTVTRLGVIYLPAFDEMFSAMLGHGTLLNGYPVRVSNISMLDDALIHVGDFAKDGDSSENERRSAIMARLAKSGGRTSMVGTSAMDLSYVACGRADALVMYSTSPWSIKAGCLLLTEAGGKASILKDDLARTCAIFSNGLLHQQVVDLII